MKRRSARPVVVEVKRTRSSTSSPTGAFGRSQSSKSLWQGVLLRAEAPTLVRREPEQPAAAMQKAEHDDRPAPRVLPALVPLYDARGGDRLRSEPADLHRCDGGVLRRALPR